VDSQPLSSQPKPVSSRQVWF